MDRSTTVALMHAIADRLVAITTLRPWIGWQVIPLIEDADFVDFDVDRQQLECVTKGLLPALNVNLSFDVERGASWDPNVEALMVEYGMVPVAEL